MLIFFGALPTATVSEAGVVVKLIPFPFRIDYPSAFNRHTADGWRKPQLRSVTIG